MKKGCATCKHFLLTTIDEAGNDYVRISYKYLMENGEKFEDEDHPVFKECIAPLPEYLENLFRVNSYFGNAFLTSSHLQEHFNFIGENCDAWMPEEPA